MGSNKRTVTLMATTSRVKAETYASARCRVSGQPCNRYATPLGFRERSRVSAEHGIRCAVYQKSYIYLAIARRLTLYFANA